MPNRTIYVADADVPVFEKAQKLAGDNLSAAIAHALRTFVEREEAKQSGYEEVTVRVGKGRPYLQQQFRGRLIAKRRLNIGNEARLLTMNVYQTARGRFAVYTKNQPNWSAWSHHQSKKSGKGGNWNWDWDWDWSHGDQSSYDWSAYYEDNELRLDVYDTLDELKENIPEELYDAITRYLKGDDVEILDI
ncbi:MAG TPA: EXLDI protein [Ktedonobacteraceae bacterium]|nr:EXLDI protein [Ktedonobacteraceae bacterium]